MCGHDWLKEKGRRHEWGVGRHILGSQIFDYWRDPWGHTLEHWTDGDLLDAPWGSRRRYHPGSAAHPMGSTTAEHDGIVRRIAMKIVRYEDKSGTKLGAVKGDGVVELTRRFPLLSDDMIELIKQWPRSEA